MKTILSSILSFAFFISVNGQVDIPISINTESTPTFGSSDDRAAGDSCGMYFNDYVGLHKTTTIFTEYLADHTSGPYTSATYLGRAQRYNAPQPMEVGGVKFYSYFDNPSLDSIRVFTFLWDWDDAADSIGTMLATDTVWVTHTSYTPVLPDVEVISYFDSPVTVSDSYLVGVIADTEGDNEDSLFIYRNANPDGASEGLGYAYYENGTYPGSTGWYNFAFFGGPGGGYDIDYMIAPYVKYDLHESFDLLDDTVCLNDAFGACVDYTQLPVFSDEHYNGGFASTSDPLNILWGDGSQISGLTSGCHTYDTAGTYSITMQDTLFRYSFFAPNCVVNVSKDVFIKDIPTPGFTNSTGGLTIDFTNTSTNADSVWWDFGDGTAGTDENDPSHSYDTLGTYEVWLYAYNECGEDSVMVSVTTDDVGIDSENNDLVIYPNPANQHLIIEGVSNGSQLQILNLLGQVVYSNPLTENKEKIDVSELSEGSYFIKVTSEGIQRTKKIIVRH